MRLWPVREPAQEDYERLREASLAGVSLRDPAGARFERGGLGALIVRPSTAGSLFVASLSEVPRPRWSPYSDPRLEILAAAYNLLTQELPGNPESGEQLR